MKKKLLYAALVLLLAIIIYQVACHKIDFAAIKVYQNGNIVTLDTENPVAEAMAVSAGRIVAIGYNGDVEDFAGDDAEIVDLEGKTIVPGFYAAHDHYPASATARLFKVDLTSPPRGKIEKMEDLISALRIKARDALPGEWIAGWGYDDTLLEEKRHPTREDLDEASRDQPIWITHISGHIGVANSKALELAKISRTTAAPPGAVIQRDASSEPNGVLEECGDLIASLIPPPNEDDRMIPFRESVEEYASQGVTTAVVAGGGRQSLLDLQTAKARGLLKIRIIKLMSRDETAPSLPESGGLLNGFGDDFLKLGAIKIWQDGSIQGYTGYLSEPYETPYKGNKGYRGYPRRSRAELTSMVKTLHRAGYQVAIHANGDAAIDDALQAIWEAQRDYPREDTRHRIEHCQMIRPDQFETAKEIGVTPSFFVDHVYYWGDRHLEIFLGQERAERISPLNSALQNQVRFTIHNDTPVTPVNPLHLIAVAVNRTTSGGKVLGETEKIRAIEALKAVTINAAWQNFEEKEKGSIEVGKLADFVILNSNPADIVPDQIQNIQVLETVVGGETVYKRPPEPEAEEKPSGQ